MKASSPFQFLSKRLYLPILLLPPTQYQSDQGQKLTLHSCFEQELNLFRGTLYMCTRVTCCVHFGCIVLSQNALYMFGAGLVGSDLL